MLGQGSRSIRVSAPGSRLGVSNSWGIPPAPLLRGILRLLKVPLNKGGFRGITDYLAAVPHPLDAPSRLKLIPGTRGTQSPHSLSVTQLLRLGLKT